MFRQLAQCVPLGDVDPQPSRSVHSKLGGILDIPLPLYNAAIACSTLEAKLLSASTPTCTLNAAAEPFVPFCGPAQLLVPILEKPLIEPASHLDINYDDFQFRLTEHDIVPNIDVFAPTCILGDLFLDFLVDKAPVAHSISVAVSKCHRRVSALLDSDAVPAPLLRAFSSGASGDLSHPGNTIDIYDNVQNLDYVDILSSPDGVDHPRA